MSLNLAVLCLSACALVAALCSAVLSATLPWVDRFAAQLSPRDRARLWLGVAALPEVVAALSVGASFLPALGIGHDHCLAHGSHHPHLCPHHTGAPPGIVLVCVALLLGLRLLYSLVWLARRLWLSGTTSAALAQVSEVYADALVMPSDEPQAFVLGTIRPRVHISSGLLALGDDIIEPVLAHERVHAQRRDVLWRMLYATIAVGHLPPIARALRVRLCAAQEMAADVEAAETMRDGALKIAEALLMLAKAARLPASTVSFTGGDLQSRVRALLQGRRSFALWPVRLLVAFSLFLPAAFGVSHGFIHHFLETALGALS